MAAADAALACKCCVSLTSPPSVPGEDGCEVARSHWHHMERSPLLTAFKLIGEAFQILTAQGSAVLVTRLVLPQTGKAAIEHRLAWNCGAARYVAHLTEARHAACSAMASCDRASPIPFRLTSARSSHSAEVSMRTLGRRW